MRRFTTALTLALTIWTFAGMAQNAGIRAGLDVLNIQSEIDLLSTSYPTQIGFHAGVMNEWTITDRLSFEYGVLVSNKRIRSERTLLGIDRTVTMNPYYFDVPIMARYYFGSGTTRYFVALGPTINIGVFGKRETTFTEGALSHTEKRDIKWGSASDDDLEPFEYTIAAGIGVRVRNFEVGLGYQHALNDVSPLNDRNQEFRRRVFQFNLGYVFGKRAAEEDIPEE